MDEQEIIQRARAGDPQAQSILVNRYSKRVYNLALRILRNREEAEDVLQETFLTVINKLDTFDGRSSFFTWVYLIATNAALMVLRKKKIRRANFRDNDFDPDQIQLGNTVDWSQNPAASIENEEIRRRINEALATLKEKYRTVFVLRDIEGLSTRETAEILNITEENVKIRLLRARQSLRNYLSQYFDSKEAG